MTAPQDRAAIEARLDEILLEIRASEEQLSRLRNQAAVIIENAKGQVEANTIRDVRSRLRLES